NSQIQPSRCWPALAELWKRILGRKREPRSKEAISRQLATWTSSTTQRTSGHQHTGGLEPPFFLLWNRYLGFATTPMTLCSTNELILLPRSTYLQSFAEVSTRATLGIWTGLKFSPFWLVKCLYL